MPDEKPTVPEVNLLPGEDFEGKPGGQFLQWALTWGKRIVVTTELIVILAFLSRFWLDTQVANLADSIDQEKLIVQSASDFEKNFRALTDRIAKANDIEKISSPLVVYDQVEKLIPSTVTIKSFSYTNSSVTLTGVSDEISFGQLVDAFKSSSFFINVAVPGVSKAIDTTNVNFTLTATYQTKTS